jgi:GNAT superfamily N-acetyltransferase
VHVPPRGPMRALTHEMAPVHSSLTGSVAITETMGKETLMDSRGSLTVQRVTAVDPVLAAELDALFDEGMTWDPEQGERFLAHPDTLLLLARWEGETCGFLSAYRLPRFDRRRAEVLLYEIGVQEPFQRRGVGRALVEEAKRWATEVGADELWVLTEDDNAPARALYTATGGSEKTGITVFEYVVESSMTATMSM